MKQLNTTFFAAPILALSFLSFTAQAQDASTPQGLVESVVGQVMGAVKADPAMQNGDMGKIRALVDAKILPQTDFERTTRLAMGPAWNKATPEQRQQIKQQFEMLLVNTYAGALAQVKNQTVTYKPAGESGGNDAVVRSQINNSSGPIELDYRLGKTAQGWKVYDLNVMGAWLIEAYRTQFRDIINQKGVDGLLQFLTEKNKAIANGQSGS